MKSDLPTDPEIIVESFLFEILQKSMRWGNPLLETFTRQNGTAMSPSYISN